MTPLTPLQQRLCEQHLPLARQIAHRKTHPGETQDDLLSDALWGLVLAARDYQPDRHVPFGAYARIRINGQIADGRRHRTGSSHGRHRPQPLPLDRDPGGVHSDPASLVSLRDQLNQLPARDRLIITAQAAGHQQHEIGRWLNITASRVSQLRACALHSLA